ncbi:S9 family peptidase [Sporolactobacillus terrae]|uniref:Peptidase n=1 Tax=Sporolactobacillus terrae TaxID=269673 RepID=A0ABX5Q4U4_9BACL|nr:S9 family peptidase [Sporolactobacillus terrae]QAA21629.1 peptidase [Sporolactobacillus terrae]QAA24601.1 peptidase [Sporolactobacillus terrae]UAK16438.1 S9 family peptidase [Sporolactobacillus terrae]
MSGKRIKINDLFHLASVSSPTISLDGKKLVYVTTILDEQSDCYQSDLIYRDLETETEKRLTRGGDQNTSPLWSPDGTMLMYLSDRDGSKQVYVQSVPYGKPRKVTQTEHGISQFFWHPDSEHILFSTKIDVSPKKGQIETDVSSADRPNVLRITKVNYKSNAEGLFEPNLEDRICIQSIKESKFKILTDYSIGYGLKRLGDISPDGRYLLCERQIEKENPFNQDTGVWLIDLQTGEQEWVTEPYKTGVFGEATFSPDGNYIAMIGNAKRYETPNQFTVYLFNRVNNELVDLLPNQDMQLGDWAVGDFQQNRTTPCLQWGFDSKSVYFTASVEGGVDLYQATIDGDFEQVTEFRTHIFEFTVSPIANQAIIGLSAPDVPSDLYPLNLGKKQLGAALTHMNQAQLSQGETAKYEPIHCRTRDGQSLGGFLVYPIDYEEGGNYPLVLNIHGGPYTMHAATFYHEVQVMAASGYAVLLLNPRGSFGYGQTFVSQVTGHYGEGDYRDLMDGLDFVLDHFSFIDHSSLYVTGGSYGGFMTNWIVSHTNRFKRAITQRSMSNFVSLFGTSDIGYHFIKDEMHADIHDVETLWKKSPLAYVHNVVTPILIMQSEQDYRCPMEQAEQWYTALKYDRKEAEFIRFPNSTHEISRSGIPSLRIKRLKLMMEWFGK